MTDRLWHQADTDDGWEWRTTDRQKVLIHLIRRSLCCIHLRPCEQVETWLLEYWRNFVVFDIYAHTFSTNILICNDWWKYHYNTRLMFFLTTTRMVPSFFLCWGPFGRNAGMILKSHLTKDQVAVWLKDRKNVWLITTTLSLFIEERWLQFVVLEIYYS